MIPISDPRQIVRFVVPGRAGPKVRGRTVFRRFAKPHTYTPDPTGYADRIVAAARQAGLKPAEGPVHLYIVEHRAMPKSWSAKERRAMAGKLVTTRPDILNVAMAVYDALTGVAYHDDAQAHGTQEAVWSDDAWTEVQVTQSAAQGGS